MRIDLDGKLPFVLLLLGAAAVGALAAFLFISKWYVIDAKEIPVTFTVAEENSIGFALGTDSLAFGKVPRGGGGDRNVAVTSSVDTVVHVRLSNLRGWVTVPEDAVRLSAGEDANLTFRLDVPLAAPLGAYEGSLRLLYVRPLPWG